MHRRTTVIVGALAVAAGLLALAAWRGALPQSTAPRQTFAIDLRWPAAALRYQLRYESEVQFRDVLRDGSRRTLVSSAELKASLWRDPSSGELRLAIDDLSASTAIDGKAQPGSSFLIPRLDLAAELDSRGKLTRLDYPASLAEGPRHLIRTIIAAAQLTLPENGGIAAAASWTADEVTPEGTSRAVYRVATLDPARDGATFSPPVSLPAGGQSGQLITKTFGSDALRGSARIALQNGWIVASDVRIASIRAGTSGDSRVSLRLLSDAAIPGDYALAVHRRLSTDLSGRDDRERHQRQQLAELAGDATVGSLTDELIALQAAPIRDRQKVIERLAALLELRPSLCAEAAGMLRGQDPLGSVFNGVAATLGSIGSPEAEAALRDMLREFYNQPRPLKQILPNVAMVASPSAETESEIRKLAVGHPDASVRRTATMALGSVAHQLRASEAERAEAIVDGLGSMLHATDEPLPREVVVRALGNVGIEAQLPYLRPFLEDDDARSRALATDALRFVEGQTALELLAARLADSDETVRLRAAEALSYAKPRPNALSLYKDRLSKETSVSVMKALIRDLALLARAHPEAVRELESFVSRCAHPDLCPYAHQLLDGLRRSASDASAAGPSHRLSPP